MMVRRGETYRSSASTPIETDAPLDWTLALAGGDGVRLADYIEQRFGRRLPKQYVSLFGRRSMLEHTLDRLNAITPASRTLAVIGTSHADFAMPQLAGRSDHVFRQPASRDTGIALYVALAMIKRWTPNAVVTITPTDHYVAPAARYVEQVRLARGLAAELCDKVIVIGVRPTEPDPELGYVSVGTSIVELPEVRAVDGFVEKPAFDIAAELVTRGALWNTMVCCGSIDALWQMGRSAEPELVDVLDSLVPLIGTSDEDEAIEYVYRAMLAVGFSRDILERSPQRLAAIALDGVSWSDCGRRERVETVIASRPAAERVAAP
jgi:mannose-1-phosphate guanylyltransferase